MKRKFLALLMAVVLVFSFSPASFAAVVEDDVAVPYDTGAIGFGLDRTSASTADVYVNVFFSQVVDSYNVVIYLQEYVDGEWVLNTTNAERVMYNNGWNKSSCLFYNQYEDLERGVSYRIMCVSRDHIDGNLTITTAYSNSF